MQKRFYLIRSLFTINLRWFNYKKLLMCFREFQLSHILRFLNVSYTFWNLLSFPNKIQIVAKENIQYVRVKISCST